MNLARLVDPRRPLALLAVVVLPLVACAGAPPAAPAPEASAIEQQSRALSRAHAAVVGVRATALPDARSSRTLGTVRQGSGVQIGDDGLVLTIGYLILEADHVELLLGDDREVPARVVAYDVATGFGLVQSLVPLRRPVAPLGSALELDPAEPMLVASGGDEADVGMAQVVSRRAFSGYWEYHLDSALFTAPARPDHSGAALINARGELVGIGSLRVADAFGGNHPPAPGNMFVPVDLLAPILPELIARGRSSQSDRAWMGVNCVDLAGRVRVVRVTEDSPADVAGLEVGDVITSLDNVPVRSLEGLWTALWQGSGSRRAIQLQIERAGQPQTLTVHTVDRAATLRKAEGV